MWVFDSVLEYLTDLDPTYKVLLAVGGTVTIVISGLILKTVVSSDYFAYFTQRHTSANHPRDTVIVHGFGRGPYAPSLSPFVIKLETYLRIANIPYKAVKTLRSSPKGKWPWIEYNGEVMSDTEFIIRHLNSKFKVDLNKHLSVYDKGVAESVKVMSDEHLFWCDAMIRFDYDTKNTLVRKTFQIPRFVMWYLRRENRKTCYYQGIGRHTKEEVISLLSRDLRAIADVLGQKKFLMGDQPCEADCSVFGQLSQHKWHFVDTGMDTYLEEKFPTLSVYCERMKRAYYPDWDDCTTRGFTVDATK